MRKYTFIFFILFLSVLCYSQKTDSDGVNWLTFEEANKNFAENQKPILVWFNNEKVDSCRMMIDSTFSLEEVYKYLNIMFYCVNLDVYTSDSITYFDGNVFGKSEYSAFNDLVYYLLSNQADFPVMILYNKLGQGTAYYGYQSRDEIFSYLIYYAEEIYNSTEFEDFKLYYYKAYPPGVKQIFTKLIIKWKTIEEIDSLMAQNPKKILINIYSNYNIASTMMQTTTYNDPVIASYLNQNYYCISVDARLEKSLTFNGVTYENSGESHKYHNFAIAALEGKMVFPAMLILNENFLPMDRIQLYLTPGALEPIVRYYGDEAYLTQKYPEYLKTFESSFEE